MPKAEVGSTKYIANKMKAKGLQRLRWYCQICQKQCRDENGFKQHTQSEGHVRAMLLVGEDPKKYINDYSNQFQRDFLLLLKTSHGEKKVHMNNFYQEYIRDKSHVHMNATRWPSLTEFAKYLGREGICRVEEGEKGLEIQWVDDSPEAVRRREDVKRKERLMKGDEDTEAKLIEQQIRRAKEEAERKGEGGEKKTVEIEEEVTAQPVKVSLSLGSKGRQKLEKVEEDTAADAPVLIESLSTTDDAAPRVPSANEQHTKKITGEGDVRSTPKMSVSLSAKSKHVNPLNKKNSLANKSATGLAEPQKKTSNAERIMKEELQQKRLAEERRFGSGKRQRLD